MERGVSEYKEMWIALEENIDLNSAGLYLLPQTDNLSLTGRLEQERVAGKAYLLDTTDNGDAPLMAGAFIKHEPNGDPDNTGNERARVSAGMQIDGLQGKEHNATLALLEGLAGKRVILYHVDRSLAVVEKGVGIVIKVGGDGTNNQAYILSLSGESVGTLASVYQRRGIDKYEPIP